MFQDSIEYESSLFEDATHIATGSRVCLRGGWRMTWRNHMRNIRQSMKRVCRIGDVEKAARDTDLHFCILAFREPLQQMLDERNASKRSPV